MKLSPIILKNSQDYIHKMQTRPLPVNFVFHACWQSYLKMNIDTDMQWSTWEGILKYYKDKEGYLQSQLGNPEGPDSPNKKYYDPRVWLRKGEESMVQRLTLAFEDLNCINRLA